MQTKKIIKGILLIALVISLTIGINSLFHEDPDQASQTIVYITRTGGCYHTGSCGYLHSSKIAITLGEAIKRGYRPCSRCSPPSAANVNVGTDRYFLSFVISVILISTVYGIYIYNKKAKAVKKEKEEREKRRLHYYELYAYKNIKALAGVPENIIFDADNLPVDTSDPNKYDIYVSYGGKCWHSRRGCSNSYNKMHLYTALRYGKRRCSLCPNRGNVEYIIPQWYKEYISIIKIIKEYDIPT